MTTDEQALRQALDYPWANWAVFLHPTQIDVVERNFGGPARVTGSAGTGKTIVALHRAVFLARKFSNTKILLTTYSRPLVESLESGLNTLVGATGDIRRRIRVVHLHTYANEVASKAKNFSFSPVRWQDLSRYFQNALANHSSIDSTKEFLRSEFDSIIDYWGIGSLSAYKKADRKGRGSAMPSSQRTSVWPLFEDVRAQMRSDKRMTWSELAEFARTVTEANSKPPFDHVVIDEAQDFGPRELRFIMSLAPPGDYSHFFTGDSGQRIYRYPFAWSRVGIDLRGRGSTLVVNYRTSLQIRKFSRDVLGAIEPNSEDEFESGEAVSIMSGINPKVEQCSSPEEESQKLTDWLRGLLDQGVKPEEIGIFARTARLLDERVSSALGSLCAPSHMIGSGHAGGRDGIRVGTLHSAKGLEFRAVAIVACEQSIMPHLTALESADNEESRIIVENQERRLFFVGCTRPREILKISYCGEPSIFLRKN